MSEDALTQLSRELGQWIRQYNTLIETAIGNRIQDEWTPNEGLHISQLIGHRAGLQRALDLVQRLSR